jgi:hypothetical protein
VRKVESLVALLLRRVEAREMTEAWAAARARSWGVEFESRVRVEMGGRGGVVVLLGGCGEGARTTWV